MRLPLNCQVDYINDFLCEEEAAALYRTLIDEYHIDRARLVVNAGGEIIETDSFKILFASKRLIEQNSHPESIHGKTHVWSGLMAKLRASIEEVTGRKFELAMCLYYPDGNYFAPFHNDQQTSGDDTVLPSISLGEVREFCFKEESSQSVYSLQLQNGSLLIMGRYCQSRYTHSLPKDPAYKKGRINITFREPGFK